MEAAGRAEHSQRAIQRREEPAQIHLVDDDEWVRTAVGRLLRSRGFQVILHPDAESFLDAYDPDSAGCIVLDVAMPGLDGPGLHQRLLDQGDAMPVVYLTGSGDVPMCAAAMRNGAVDFLCKPVDEDELVRAVTMALQHDAVRRLARTHTAKTEARLDSLTPREREVLDHVMNGRLNKQIAADIGTAEKTVKVHRARAMEKMNVRSVAELVRMVERAHPGRGWLA